jgi:type I restriction enzyme S subunit
MPSNIEEGRVSTEGIARVGDEKLSELQNYQLGEGEIIFGRRGDIGACALVTNREEGWLCGTGCIRVNLGDASVDSTFLRYYLSQSKIGEWLENHAVGSTMANLNTEIISNIPLDLPPLPDQRSIAGILGAYDDLITNNRRRIELLEDMATAIFREWFVHYRFPGHEDVKMRETEIGEVPEGWTVKPIGELATSPRSRVDPDKMDADTPYFGLGDMPKESIALSEWGRAEDAGSKKYSFDRGDILFGKIRPYFHKVGPAPVAGICSTDAIVIVPTTDELWGFVLGHVSSDEFVELADQTSSGTKMPRAKWKILKEEYKVAVPPPPILQQFNDTIKNLVDQIHNLIYRNHTLRKTRDLLLPRLVSGKVEVDTTAAIA